MEIIKYGVKNKMLNIYFGDMPEAIYNTSVYFRNTYKDKWITTELSREMIRDIDKSEVLSETLIQSPIFGPMPPTQLSGGVKTLMLIAYDRNHIFHLMDFGEGEFKIRVMNTNKIVRNMAELTLQAVDFV